MNELIEQAQARAAESRKDLQTTNEVAIQIELLAAILEELRKPVEPEPPKRSFRDLFKRD